MIGRGFASIRPGCLCGLLVAMTSCALFDQGAVSDSCPGASRFHSAFEEGGKLDAGALLAAAADRPWEYAYAFDDILDLVTSDSAESAPLCVARILSYANCRAGEDEFVWPARRAWPAHLEGIGFSLLIQVMRRRISYMHWFEEHPDLLIAALRGRLATDQVLSDGVAADVAMEVVDRYGLWHQKDVRDAMSVAASREPVMSDLFWEAETAMWRSAMRRIDRLAQGASSGK